MNFAYQFRYGGSVWNDYDHASYRDHVYAYPSIDGVIDTIQWEGFREGVDDTRYVASLIKKEGSATSAKSLISSSLSKGDSAGTIRNKVIGQILGSYTPGQVPTPTPSPTPLPTPTPTPTPIPAHSLPAAQFTASATKGVTPLTVQFTDTSVSTGTTTYEWDINNDGVVDSTVKNPSLTYTIAGTKTVKLTVKNASGSDSEVKTGYITVSLPATKNPPKAKFTASGTKGVKPMIVQFTDQSESTGTTTYEWDVNNDGVVESTVKNPSITYTIPGTKTVKLTVKNASGSDSEIKTNYITVSSPTGTTSPAITVTSPNGGETWKRGTTQTVTWNYAGVPAPP